MTEWISGNVFIRPNDMEVIGEKIEGHGHNFDHTTILFTGGIHIKAKLANGETVEQDFIAPDHCLIKAGVEHEITDIGDTTKIKECEDAQTSLKKMQEILSDTTSQDLRDQLAFMEKYLEAKMIEAKKTVFWCVYSHRTPQGDVSVENTGWNTGKAYT